MSTTANAMPRFDDRAFVLERQEALKAESQAIDHVQHYATLGYAMSEFAKAMYEGLSKGENALPRMLTVEQKLRRVCAALQGR